MLSHIFPISIILVFTLVATQPYVVAEPKDTTSKFFPATDLAIRYVGRVFRDERENKTVFDWPCVTIETTFMASSIAVTLDGGNNEFVIFLDGKELPRLTTTDSTQVYELAHDLSDTVEHTLSMHKITEASFFVFEPLLPLSRVVFHGFTMKGNARLMKKPTREQKRIIEVFGDSDSNGFGIEGPDDIDCLFSLSAYENCYLGYASLLARSLDADLYVEAWSGKGVVKNAVDYTSESAYPMPIYWNRTLATAEGLQWNFTKVSPDLIIVLLGTNDYYAWPYPSSGEFVAGYVNMLKRIVASYAYLPAAKKPTIVNLCGGTLDNDRAPCANVQSAVKAFATRFYQNTHFVEIGTDWLQYPEDYGCLEHRNVKGQQILAAKLLPTIQQIMNW